MAWICGNLGTSYDLSMVFEVMRKLDNPNLRFIVMDDGLKKGEFEE